MSAVREALVLPLIFLTVTLLAGARLGAGVALAPPSLFTLVLATMLLAALVRSGVPRSGSPATSCCLMQRSMTFAPAFSVSS